MKNKKLDLLLNEILSQSSKQKISKETLLHIEKGVPFTESVFRPGSEAFLRQVRETRILAETGAYVPTLDEESFLETDLGEYGMFEGERVPLDMPMPTPMLEAEYQGRDVELNKPKRGGSKKFYVYVRDPKTGNVKKVEFGAEGGGQTLSVKLRDPAARKSFAARHQCEKKNDKTKPGYWSCRLPRYAEQLGLKKVSAKWW